MTQSAARAIPLVTLLFVAGCPSGDDDRPSGGTSVPMEADGRTLAEKLCAAVEPCCAQNGFLDELKTCTEKAAALQDALDATRVAHPDYAYDADKATRCISDLVAAYAACNPRHIVNFEQADCEDYFRGTKPVGAACTSSQDCAGSPTGHVVCKGGDIAHNASTGVCVLLKPAAEGAPCFGFGAASTPSDARNSYVDCGYYTPNDFYCDDANKCRRRGGAGADCASMVGNRADRDACAAGTSCSFEKKTCEPLPKVGEKCAPLGCEAGAYCDREANQCVAKKQAGEPCEQPSDCLHGCDLSTHLCQANDVSREVCSGEMN